MSSVSEWLTKDLCEELMRAGKTALPREACGILVRQGDRELHALQLPNRARDEGCFEMAAEDVARALKGKAWVGSWHSHPSGDSTPSPADREACWEGGLCLVLGLGSDRNGACCGLWRLKGGVFELLERQEVHPQEATPAPGQPCATST
jgi:proteasome lid subunit RPN8/RPN11